MADHNLITDRTHLEALTVTAIEDLVELARAWIAEDHAACTPRANGEPRRTTTRPDQTAQLATGQDLDDHTPAPTVDHTKYTDRDRLGRIIATTARRLRDEIHRRTPTTPDRDCTCCRLDVATHGRDHDGRPTVCHPCHRYHRTSGGRRCGDDIHADRPRIRWCECPAECCDVCPDHAAEGRRLSERCKRRLTRHRATVA